MHLTTVTFAALAAGAAAAEPMKKFTRAATPFQLGLWSRDVSTAYAPETTECGDGESCAEACGEGYAECMANGVANHCYKPAAGETCCAYTGNGNSCEAGYFCAHNKDSKTTCCAEGKTLDECAKVNKLDALQSDPATPTYTVSAKGSKATDKATGTANYGAKTTGADSTKPTTVSQPTVAVVDKNAAGRIGAATAAVLLAAGAFTALL